ncbi:uncharacterized protein TRIADDRAFT_37144 [Trichoplax adhaerens]|uniref:alpha-L-fucosidase n=1 Tax=Trichoplax adhaerens TaxID=10228 RepID=B3RMV0_TRIAD|nr:hypothetical protein TRIADDRAFT_37144 [Trichoplax adhaerens]EDV27338.1 hypothetical protein TRIADDRAFT_37144 [Trichoplax adhaerens]|eukprot:XP_002109172.1 hypothetical protein TRIADDRAFT_37144 [Trichoplax adhaerens]
MKTPFAVLNFFLVFYLSAVLCVSYQPTWESLDKRPLPDWYDKAKIGIFMHWGVFSVPSYGHSGAASEWFWHNWKRNKPDAGTVQFMKKNFRPDFQYTDFAPMFRAELYDPYEWAEIIQNSGAKYVILTSKHHEGYTLYPSKPSWNWNSMTVGSKRDLLGELAHAIRNKTKVRFGAYHSLFEWFNPIFLQDQKNNFKTKTYVQEVLMPEIHDLIVNYKPEILWADGEWAANDTYWQSKQLLAWLYNKSPVKNTIVTNDRWGKGDRNKHGGFFTGGDRYSPGTIQKHKFENAMTIDRYSWGFSRPSNLNAYLTIEELLSILAKTISCNGNLAINIGPTHDGRIVPIFQERLSQLGQWLKVNGDGIYETRPWHVAKDSSNSNVWYTSKNGTVYAIVLKWPGSTLSLAEPMVQAKETKIGLLGYKGNFSFKSQSKNKGVIINIPPLTVAQLPCKWAWVFTFTNLKNK